MLFGMVRSVGDVLVYAAYSKHKRVGSFFSPLTAFHIEYSIGIASHSHSNLLGVMS